MKIIDPHLHFFNLHEGEYAWLKPENGPHWKDKALINRDFLEGDLNVQGNELASFVHIEAGFDNERPWREIEWLESVVSRPFRSVAAIDIRNDSASQQLNRLVKYSSVVGVRHILDEQAHAILSHPNTAANLNAIASSSLLFELQMNLDDTAAVNLIEGYLRSIPNLTFIINHAGFPSMNDNAGQQLWRDNLARLAAFDNCAIKCSGWEMQSRLWQWSWALDVVVQCVEQFGLHRVMIASNSPVSELSMSYSEYWQGMISQLPFEQSDIAMLVHDNAKQWYRF